MNLNLCLPAAWHRSGRAQPAAPRRELDQPVGAPAVPASRLPRRRVVLILAVEETDILKARKSIPRAGGNAVELLQSVRIRGTSRVRLRVNLEDGAVVQTLHHVMRGLTADESGGVAVIRSVR